MRMLVCAALCLFACGRGVSPDCARLDQQYASAVPIAQSCDPAQPDSCNAQAFDSIAPTCTCCFTAVTEAGAAALEQIYDQSNAEGCPGPALVPCPEFVKLAHCVADAADAGRCE